MAITVIGMWEPGFSDEQMFIEWRIWKEVIDSYDVERWIMVGKDVVGSKSYESFDSFIEALESTSGARIFLQHTGKHNMKDYVFPKGDIVLCFGNSSETMDSFISEGDDTVRVVTPKPYDQFACTILSITLYECR